MPDALGSSHSSQKHVHDALQQILVLQNLIKHSLLGGNKKWKAVKLLTMKR